MNIRLSMFRVQALPAVWDWMETTKFLKRLLGLIRSREGWPHPLLAQALTGFARRVGKGYWIESLRLALLWGGGTATALVVTAWLAAWASPEATAALGGSLVGAFVLSLRLLRRPDALQVAHIADAHGLAGRAITAFRLLQKDHTCPWEQTAVAASLASCRDFPAEAYPPAWSLRPWRGPFLILILTMVTMLVPNPLRSHWETRWEERQALAETAEQAKKALDPLYGLQVDQRPLIDDNARRELQTLTRKLEEAGEREKSAAQLLQTRQFLEMVREELSPSALQDASRLADIWGENHSGLSAALQQGDADQAGKALQALWQEALETTGAGRDQAALQFLRSAEAAKDPALRQAFREAAKALSQGGMPGSEPAGSPDALPAGEGQALGQAVASLAGQAGASAALGRASLTLSQLAYSLSAGAGSEALAQGGGGASSGGEQAGMSASPGRSGPSGPGGDPAGEGGSAGPGYGSQSAGESGQEGGGSSSANGSGQPGSGERGSGGGSGSGGMGAGTSGGGLNSGNAFLLGGQGPESQVTGEIRAGEAGAPVSLPGSPTSPGAVRAYQESYGQYAEEARQSLVRSPLPPALETLVWQYFSSLDAAPVQE